MVELTQLSNNMPMDDNDIEEKEKKDNAELTLKQLLVNEDMFDNIYEILNISRFFHDFPFLRYVWDSCNQYFEMYRELPSFEVLRKGLHRGLPDWAENFSDNSITKEYIDSFIEELKKYNEETPDNLDKDKNLVSSIVKEHIKWYAREVYDSALQEGLSLEDAADQFNNITQKGIIQPVKFESIDIDDLLQRKIYPPVSTNVEFLDLLTGGGFRPGETVGITMPMNMGKTTLAWQLMYNNALQKKHVVLITVEQPLSSDDLIKRNMKHLFGVSQSEIDNSINPETYNLDTSKLPEGSLERARKQSEILKYYTHVTSDFVDTPIHSMEQFLKAPIESLNNRLPEGEKVSLVLIDHWTLVRAQLLMTAPDFKLRNINPQQYEGTKLQQVKSLGSLGCNIVIFNQMSGSEAEKKAGTKRSGHSGEGNKLFDQYNDIAFVSDKLDEDLCTTFWSTKTRQSGKGSIEVQLDGEYGIFRPLNLMGGGRIQGSENISEDPAGSSEREEAEDSGGMSLNNF